MVEAPGLNPLDAAGQSLVAALTGRSLLFDWLVNFFFAVPLAKFGIPVLLALYAWLDRRPAEPPGRRAQRVAFSFLGVLLAIGTGRAAQDLLLARPRPREGLPWFDFTTPPDLPDFSDYSSFPSDHAVLAAALAVAAFAHSRGLGLTSVAWGVVVVAFPRLYFGLHYVSDLLGGALIGTAVTLLVMRLGRPATLPGLLQWAERRAPVFLTLFLFLVAYEYIELFGATRRVLGAIRDVWNALS